MSLNPEIFKSRWLKYLVEYSSDTFLPTQATFGFAAADRKILWSISNMDVPRSPEIAMSHLMDNAANVLWQSKPGSWAFSDGRVSVTLTYPPTMTAPEAIRTLCITYGELPRLIRYTLLLVLRPQLPRKGRDTRFCLKMLTMFGLLYADPADDSPQSPPTAAEIQTAVLAALDNAVQRFPLLTEVEVLAQHHITNMVDVARYMLCLCAKLWDTKTQRHYQNQLLNNDHTISLRNMAHNYADYIGQARTDWLEGVELLSATSDTIRFLTRLPLGDGDGERLATWTKKYAARTESALLNGVCAASLRAATPPHYVPAGMFYVVLPPVHPLRELDIVHLAVVADAQGLWCTPLFTTHRLVAFRWKPHAPYYHHWLEAESSATYALILHATLAALWHDLCVAGETVIVTTRPRAAGPAPELEHPARKKGKHARQLPRRKVVRQTGPATERVVAWESLASTRTAAHAHAVCGHPRRLLDGQHASELARQFAGDYGVIVPDGYTFVRPHVRGAVVAVGETPEPTPVKAKGLLTLSLLLQKENQ